MSIVIDASVVAAAFFPEPAQPAAAALLADGQELFAPDLLLAEVANVIWKRHGRGEIDAAEAHDLLADMLRLPIDCTPSVELIEAALELAVAVRRTVYDSLYLALAVREGAVMVTGDERLVNAISSTPLAASVRWIGGA
jgi:predicted nucleic acid-binding protein